MTQDKFLSVCNAIAATLLEAGEVPEGTVYAVLMGQMSLDEFNFILESGQKVGLWERSACHLLKPGEALKSLKKA